MTSLDRPREITVPRGFRRAATTVGGGVLVLVGLIGLVLPLVPGTAFLLAGVVLWPTEFGWAKQLLARVKQWIKDCSSQERRRELLRAMRRFGTHVEGDLD